MYDIVTAADDDSLRSNILGWDPDEVASAVRRCGVADSSVRGVLPGEGTCYMWDRRWTLGTQLIDWYIDAGRGSTIRRDRAMEHHMHTLSTTLRVSRASVAQYKCPAFEILSVIPQRDLANHRDLGASLLTDSLNRT
jgi:hypothetical protein